MDTVWKDAFVTDTSLAEAVSFLRQALGDDPQAPRYVQTVHRRGYRFVAPLLAPAPSVEQIPEPVIGVEPRSVVYPSIARELLPWSVATICAALAIAALWQVARQPAPAAPPAARFEVQPSPGTAFDRRAPAIDVSSDGRTIAWSACEVTTGTCGLYVRPLDRLDAARLAGTDGAMAPFFSPDGRWLGFFADGKLKKIAIAGGAPTAIADAPAPGGASWNTDGRIIFAGLPAGGLSIASDQGGEVARLTTPRVDRGEVRHLWPAWLPDGRNVIFTIASSLERGTPGELAIVSPPAATFRVLRTGVTRGIAAGRGYLLLTSAHDVQGVSFDDRALSLTGGTDTVLGGLAAADGVAQFAVSASGTLVAQREPASETRITWQRDHDRVLTAAARLSSIALSPDGTRAAGVIADGSGSDIWIARLDTGALTRVTFGGTNVSPAWSGDGRRVFFASRTNGPFHLVARTIEEHGTLEVLSASRNHVFPSSASADGRVAVTTTLASGRLGIGIVGAAGGAPRLITDAPFDETSPSFSPDGEWLAYASDESGRWEVFARRLSDGRRVPVSRDGGQQPSWSRDGQWIYFHEGARLMRARFAPERQPNTGTPEVLLAETGARALAIAPDGRILIARDLAAPDRAIVALEWLRDVRQKLPPPVTAPR
jgi:serine/threonine-protein kinase